MMVKPVDVRQLTVGDDHVVVTLSRFLQAVTPVGAVIDAVANLPQAFDQIFGSLQIVFDEQ